MKKINWGFWLGIIAVILGALDALQMLWQPLLPPGLFAALATIVGVGSRVTSYLVDEDRRKDLDDDGVINGSHRKLRDRDNVPDDPRFRRTDVSLSRAESGITGRGGLCDREPPTI